MLGLVNRSNVAIPGRWMFRVDSAKIEAGGCNTKGMRLCFPFPVFETVEEPVVKMYFPFKVVVRKVSLI